MDRNNLLGIIGGAAMGFFGAKMMQGGGSPPADLEEAAEQIAVYDTASDVFLHRIFLFNYRGWFGLFNNPAPISWPAACWAWVLNNSTTEKNQPQCFMSVTRDPASGKIGYEFGGHGPALQVFHSASPQVVKLNVPPSVYFSYP